MKGNNNDPFRLVISIFVDDIFEYFNNIKMYDSKLINDEPVLVCTDAPGEERWAGSFFDVEGNCIQMIQMTGK